MKVTDNLITDPAGLETLDVFEKANRFNRWMFEVIAPHCKGKVLEIGSGIGNISTFFVENNFDIYLSDFREEYCNSLIHRFSDNKLAGISQIDLADPVFKNRHSHLLSTFETVFSLNVLEHIENHELAIKHCFELLKPGGNLVILVPAYPFLFCRFDIELGHFRRYTRKTIQSVIISGGFMVNKLFSFNMAGIAGWLIFGKFIRKKQIESAEMGLFNKLVPVFKIIDRLFFKKIGLSLIIVATKPES